MKYLLPLLLLCAGCVHTEYTTGDGAKFSRTAFLSPTAVGEVSIGDKKATISGYKSETAQVVQAAVEATAKALVK